MACARLQKVRAAPARLLDCGVAASALAGQAVSGDLHLVRDFPGGILVAVVDGVGHGAEAAAAARAAVGILGSHPAEPLTSLVRRCHLELRGTRGAVMTLAAVIPGTGQLAWLAVGNVEAVLLRGEAETRAAAERLVLRNGLVGCELPELRVSMTPIARGDLLVLATDGVGRNLTCEWDRTDPPLEIAGRILRQSWKRTDDALVLVARYLGRDHE